MIEIIAEESDVVDGALTVRAFCDRYSIGRTAFYEEVDSGRLIAKKRGGKILIPLTNARAWLETLPNLKSRATAANSPTTEVAA